MWIINYVLLHKVVLTEMIESHFYVMSMVIHLAHGPLIPEELVVLYSYLSHIRERVGA